MSYADGQMLSPAAAAGLLGVPVWFVHALVKRRVFSSVRVHDRPRISEREIRAFLKAHRPEEAA